MNGAIDGLLINIPEHRQHQNSADLLVWSRNIGLPTYWQDIILMGLRDDSIFTCVLSGGMCHAPQLFEDIPPVRVVISKNSDEQ